MDDKELKDEIRNIAVTGTPFHSNSEWVNERVANLATLIQKLDREFRIGDYKTGYIAGQILERHRLQENKCQNCNDKRAIWCDDCLRYECTCAYREGLLKRPVEYMD